VQGILNEELVCRSVQLRSSEVPSASVLFDVALGMLRSIPELMPCNRIAISTNSFQPLPGSDGGLLDQMFAAPRLKPKPLNVAADEAMKRAGMGPAELSKSAKAAAAPKLNVAGFPHSIQQRIQPLQSSKRALVDGAYSSQLPQQVNPTAGVGAWVQRKHPKLESVVTSGMGSNSPDTHNNAKQGTAAPCASSSPSQNRDAAGSQAGARQGAGTSAAGRWMQWAQQAATEKSAVKSVVKSALIPGSAEPCAAAERHTTSAAQPQAPTAHATPVQGSTSRSPAPEVVDLSNEPECDLCQIDIAEQRHIINLIQMNANKAGNQTPQKRAASARQDVRKQSSILSLLNKR
jgi:hypothetical protein